MRPTVRAALAGAGALAAAGTAAAVWGLAVEPHLFTVRRSTLPVLPAGAPDIRVLHISDLHLAPWQKRKMAWVQGLSALQPDLVINTGDNLAAPILPELLETYDGLLDVPGVFVLGSNDFFAPQLKNPMRYLWGPSKVSHAKRPADLPTMRLVDSFAERGWEFLDNRSAALTVRGVSLSFAGLGDAHINRDRIDEDWPSFAADATADLRIGVAHAPYLRVLDAFADAGAQLIFAGHTHGGQVRVPGYGALVTNCDLPTAHASGVFEHRSATVCVSAGLGFSPFAPVRFACRPEVSLLTLTAAG